MKRKFYGVLMLGALAVASASLTSCKDYDDDINNLQTQVNSLSQTVDQKEAAIKQLITDLDAAYKKADVDLKAAYELADKDLEASYKAADVATLAAAKQAIADAKADLEATINSNYATLDQKNKEQDAAIVKAQTAADQALSQLSQLSSQLTTVAQELRTSIAAAQSSLTQVSNELAALTAKFNTLSSDLNGALADIADLKTAVKGQQAALEAFSNGSGDYSQIKTDITALLAKLSALEAQVGSMTSGQTTTIAQEITTIKADIEPLKTSVNDLETKVNDFNAKLNTITTALAKALRSLVYMPYLYVDGIESIEYPYLVDTALTTTTVPTITRQRTGITSGATVYFEEDYQKTISGVSDSKFPKLAKLEDYIVKTPLSIEYFGPAWPVDYHMNPSRSTTAWGDIKGWNRRNAEVITRSTAGDNGAIQVAEKYADGTQLFNNSNGVLTVGIKVTQPQNLANHAITTETVGRPGTYTEEQTAAGYKNTGKYQYDDILALQVNSKNGGNADTLITSDYAMIYPEKAWIEGLVWTKHHSKLGYSLVNYDEPCAYSGNKNHVWDSPKEALAGTDNAIYPDIELYYNDEAGICLKDLLGVHIAVESKTIKNGGFKTINLNSAEFGRWGLSCEFQLVGYSIDGNTTIDSNYATFKDGDEKGVSPTGTIIAKNVKEDGTTIDTQSATSVDREPLVRVLIKRGDRVILDGYILVHITRATPDVHVQQLIVDNYPQQTATFNLCDDNKVFNTNWSEFSSYVLTTKLENMTKEDFDAQYGLNFAGVPDLMGTVQPVDLTPSPVTLADNSVRYDDVQLFYCKDESKPDDKKEFVACKARDISGYVRYYHNSIGTTNHRFEWIISADEQEEWTHENVTLPREITRYFRYTKVNANAKYDYIYVKMTIKLDRKTIAESGIKDKNKNYWYSTAGEDATSKGIFDVVVWNPWYPQNGGNTRTYQQDLVSTFAANYVQFVNTTGLASNINNAIKNGGTGTTLAKYFFVPVETEIIAQDGTKYTITPRSGKNDQKWNAFVCKYERWENDGTKSYVHDGTHHNLHWYSAANDKTYTEHKWSDDPAKNKEIHEKCAINYNDGVYMNNKLYAVKSSLYSTTTDYTEIATLNQNIESGQMKLTWRADDNDITKIVLNAIGYVPENKNIINATPEITENGYTFDACKTGILHTMVGVVANNGCNVAINIPEWKSGETNVNANTFWVSWNRPINVKTESNPMVDAKNNGDYIYTVDFLKLYDWRGPVFGYMYDNQQWLWSYYNIKKVKLDTRPAQVYTNMHQSSTSTFVQLSNVTTMAQFGVLMPDGTVSIGQLKEIPIDVTAYNADTKNIDLLKAMGLYNDPDFNKDGTATQAQIDAHNQAILDAKLAFAGGLYYANNGDHVQEFDLKVPVYVVYDWGEFKSEIKVHIDRTLGH